MQTRTLLARSALLVLASAAVLAGCRGHGKFTSEAIEQAELRQAQMKAATEWDMARQQFLSGDLRKALRSIDNSIAFNPDVVKSHVLKARVHIEKGELETALESLADAERVHDELQEIEAPDDRRAGRGRLDEARAEHLTEVYYYEGVVLERLSKYEEALESFRAAMDSDETNIQYPMAAAEMLVELGRLDDAKNLLNAKMQRFEHNPGIRQALGHIAMMEGNAARAVGLFEEACLLGPGDFTLREDLVRAQLADGRYAEAETSLAWLLTEPEYADRDDLQRLHAKLLIKSDRPVEARELLMRLTSDKRYSGDVELWIDLGDVAALLKDAHGLRAAGQRVKALAPDRADGYIFTAMYRRSRGELEQAVQTLAQAVERAPDDARAPMLRGLILTQMGRRAEAERAFALAVQRDPENEQARRLLAAAQRRGSAVAEAGRDD